MLCEICKMQDAAVDYASEINGEERTLHLCEECAARKDIGGGGPLSLTDLLYGMGVESDSAQSDKSCPQCHMRRGDFKKTSRLGCPECYRTFADDLAPILKHSHRDVVHVGRFPECERQAVELRRLERELRAAVTSQEFEDAARLRDRIQSMRTEPSAREIEHEG